MAEQYQVYNNLQQHKTRLLNEGRLVAGSASGSETVDGVGLAAWNNRNDRVIVDGADHHTLSLYVENGYESYLKTPHGWKNGGAPDRLCLMPKGYASTWDIRGELTFVHLYFTDRHLSQIAEQVWDKSPAGLTVDEHIFADDPQVAILYRQFLLASNWHDNADRLMLSSATAMLLTHLVKEYTHFQWTPLTVKGGLAPFQLARVKAFVDANIDQPLLLADLAALVQLSEFHFARMFKQSVGLAPHQYVMQQRLLKAEQLLKHTDTPLTDIAQRCGFSSSSHFSNRFRQLRGTTPSQYRRR